MSSREGFTCPKCGEHAAPVWAEYEGTATVDGESGSGTVLLPMHRCANGDISGWRPEDDFMVDLAMEVERTDYEGLGEPTVEPRSRFLRRSLCGNCGNKLEIAPSGARLRVKIRRTVRTCPDPIELDMTIPDGVCKACGARPDPMNRAVANSIADTESWLFQLLAGAMSMDSAETIRPR